MNITCLFGLLPPHQYMSIINNSKGNIQFAADSLQKSILSGLSYHSDSISLVNLPFIGSWPNRYKSIRLFDSSFEYRVEDKIIPAYNVGFLNVSGYKLFSRYFNAYNFLIKQQQCPNVILIYSIHTPFLKAAVDVKKKLPNTKIVLVVPDLPQYMSQRQSVVRNIFQRINKYILSRMYKYVDGYILLSKYMVDCLPVKDKPWAIIEGIFNPSDKQLDNHSLIEGRYILYTGTLARRYGILNLLEAFKHLDVEDVKLVICGEGDSKDEILEAAKSDARIIYMGILQREDALKLQQCATLLVNPRTPEGEFTKYSFPSKTMEYLASGVPTLLYRLPGIPEEYYNYCFSIDNVSVSALSDELDRILKLNPVELKILGEKARNFIYTHKSPIVQTKKIVDILQSLG